MDLKITCSLIYASLRYLRLRLSLLLPAQLVEPTSPQASAGCPCNCHASAS